MLHNYGRVVRSEALDRGVVFVCIHINANIQYETNRSVKPCRPHTVYSRETRYRHNLRAYYLQKTPPRPVTTEAVDVCLPCSISKRKDR